MEANEDLVFVPARAQLGVTTLSNPTEEDSVTCMMDNVARENDEAMCPVAVAIGMVPTDPEALLGTSFYEEITDPMRDGSEVVDMSYPYTPLRWSAAPARRWGDAHSPVGRSRGHATFGSVLPAGRA